MERRFFLDSLRIPSQLAEQKHLVWTKQALLRKSSAACVEAVSCNFRIFSTPQDGLAE